jgi:hypothetical protein
MSTPALAADTWLCPGIGRNACGAEMLTTLAPGFFRKPWLAFITWTVPIRSISTTLRKALADMPLRLAGKFPAAPRPARRNRPMRRAPAQARLDRRHLAHIGREPHRLRAQRLQRGDGVVDLVLRPAGHGHPRAMAGEQLRDAAIDAAGAADHDHGLAAEIDGDAHDAGALPLACRCCATLGRAALGHGKRTGPDATLRRAAPATAN